MANQWTKGCGIGCAGCAVVVLLVVGVLIALAPGSVRSVNETIERHRLLGDWVGPPEGAPVDLLLPPELDGLLRTTPQPGPGPEWLGLSSEIFLNARYERAERSVDVHVLRAEETHRDELFERASDAVSEGSYGTRVSSHIGNILAFRLGNPDRDASLWWADQWLFVFVGKQNDEPRELADALLRSFEGSTRVEAEDDE